MKIAFNPVNSFPKEHLDRNKAHTRDLALPLVGECGDAHKPPLAIVGGGPSIALFEDELREWDGEVFAINGAFRWCRERGIDCGFYSIDPSPVIAEDAKGADRAILADICVPEVFEAVTGPIEVFPIGELPSGSTTASTAPMIAARRGNASITLFGCESSFTGRVHAYGWTEENTGRVLVEVAGAEYLTTPQLIMQSEYLLEIARALPGYVAVRGEGFLPALIEHGDYSVLKVSRDIAESLNGG